MGSWQYDETDFERLSLIMMLHDLDFTVEEIKKYMKLSLGKNEREWLKLLNKKRKGIFHPFLLKIFPTQKDAEAAFVASGVFASLTSVTP